MSIHYKETQYGFEYGAARFERAFHDEKKGWIGVLLYTEKHPYGIQIHVTKTGKVVIASATERYDIKALPAKKRKKLRIESGAESTKRGTGSSGITVPDSRNKDHYEQAP